MSVNLRLPNITGQTDSERITQVSRFLYQLTEQLNFALNEVGERERGEKAASESVTGSETEEEKAYDSFTALKSLIIKSADIVNAYYDEINRRLTGEYVAISDFGTYKQETANNITENSEKIESLFTNLQQIINEVGDISEIIANAYIKSGLLYYDESGAPVYGIELGQRNSENGEEVFNKYARFTSGKLSFYDKNDTEVAYISDYKLVITNAEIKGNLTVGEYLCDTANGIALKWIGG